MWIISLFFAMIMILYPSGQSNQDPSGSTSITILHTNDFHGNYMPFRVTTGNATSQTGDEGRDTLITFEKEGQVGGFAYLAAVVNEVRNEKGEDRVLLLDAGDAFADNQLANLTEGMAMIQLMNSLNYDLMALGNHDFDYGWERTRELQQEANFAMGAANVVQEDSGQPVFEEPFHLFQKNGMVIGVMPLGYHNTPLTTQDENIKGLQFLDGIQVVKKHLPQLREQADLVVILSHQGTAVDEMLAAEVPGIDLIIGGHSHDVLVPTRKINDTYIVQALADAAALGETELIMEGKEIKEINVKVHILWNDQIQPHAPTDSLIGALRADHKEALEEVVAQATEVIGRNYKSESPFDKLVGNLLREAYEADVALLPGVGYGISLSPGEITSEQIYRLLPHPSEIVATTLTGNQMKKVLEQSAYNLKPDDPREKVGGLLQSSGISYVLDFSQPARQRISQMVIEGKAVADRQEYKVVTHQGMLNGLHKYDVLGEGSHVEKFSVKLTDFVIERFKEMKRIELPDNMGEVSVQGR